jgi:flagellar hook protein FlgE
MSILLSALNAHEILLANASSNVANLNTDDYRSIRTTIVSPAEGTVEALVTRDAVPDFLETDGCTGSDVDLAQEFTDMIRARRGFEAILSTISARDEMLGDLMSVLSKR